MAEPQRRQKPTQETTPDRLTADIQVHTGCAEKLSGLAFLLLIDDKAGERKKKKAEHKRQENEETTKQPHIS